MDIVNQLVVESPTAKSYKIYSAIPCRLLACNNIRRNVLAEAAATLNHYVPSDVTELMYKYTAAYYCTVVNNNLTREFGRVTYDTLAPDYTVMCDVQTFHKQIVRPDSGGSF